MSHQPIHADASEAVDTVDDVDAGDAGRFGAVFDGDEVAGVLRGAFYSELPPPESARVRKARRDTVQEKPEHYKVICISMYTEDLARMDDLVRTLKRRGLTKASRSALIREALNQVDLSKIGRGM
jgi:hypothetical protein